jgi:hypothetical protein
MFPVKIYDENLDLNEEGTFYVVAGNGNFLKKSNGIVSALVPVGNVSVLDDLNTTWSRWELAKIPTALACQIQKFFAKVVEIYDAESCVILYYDRETKQFSARATKQIVTKGGVQYKRLSITHETNLLPVGTIHSHCDFEAFHSGTDIYDEKTFDGLHATFGHNDRPDFFSITSSVVVNGLRTKINPLDVIEGIEHVEDDFHKFSTPQSEEFPAEWLANVKGDS